MTNSPKDQRASTQSRTKRLTRPLSRAGRCCSSPVMRASCSARKRALRAWLARRFASLRSAGTRGRLLRAWACLRVGVGRPFFPEAVGTAGSSAGAWASSACFFRLNTPSG